MDYALVRVAATEIIMEPIDGSKGKYSLTFREDSTVETLIFENQSAAIYALAAWITHDDEHNELVELARLDLQEMLKNSIFRY